MANIDLKEAYFFIPFHPGSKKFLRSKFQNQTYEFQCSPFVFVFSPLCIHQTYKTSYNLPQESGPFACNLPR